MLTVVVAFAVVAIATGAVVVVVVVAVIVVVVDGGRDDVWRIGRSGIVDAFLQNLLERHHRLHAFVLLKIGI